MSEPLRADYEKYTYADILSWTDDTRWELIDGVPYAMTPSPNHSHQRISMALGSQFFDLLRGAPCEVLAAPFDVLLPKAGEDANSATTVLQPDLMVVCNPEQIEQRGVIGPPTLAIEILSPSTITRDMREKLQTYQRAGVPEYWIVMPEDKTVLVFTLNEQGCYGNPTVYVGEEQVPVGVLPGLVIDLKEVFAD